MNGQDKELRSSRYSSFQLQNEWWHCFVRIVRFIRRRERLDRQISAIAGGPNDMKKPIEIELDIACGTKGALFDLPVDGVGGSFLHIDIGIRRSEVAGIDDGSAPGR